MNAIVSIVTAASVLVHVVLGCAAHHAHARQVACGLTHAADNSPEPVPHQCCKHKHHSTAHTPAADHEPAPAQPQHKSCDEDRCTAILAGTVIDSVTLVTATLLADECVGIPKAIRNPTISADYASSQHDLGPPLRPHLCFCVLLI